jgi:hypothetical protein
MSWQFIDSIFFPQVITQGHSKNIKRYSAFKYMGRRPVKFNGT